MVRRDIRRADRCPGGSLARNQGRPPHADRGADRLRQDARRLPCGDRRSDPARSRRTSDRRDPGGLRLAAQGAVERHSSQPRGAAGRHPGKASADRPARRRDPHLGAHGRYARRRTRADAPPPAAHPGDDAGIALRPAWLRVRAQDAGDHALGDRRRNPRGRAEQARRASRPVARTPWRALRRPVAAHRPLRDAKPDQRGCSFPCRRRVRRRTGRRASGHRYGTSAPPRPEPRVAGFAAGGGDVGRSVDSGLRSPVGAHRGASHHAGVRQHATHGGAHRPRTVGASRRRLRSPLITAAWRRRSGFRPSRG